MMKIKLSFIPINLKNRKRTIENSELEQFFFWFFFKLSIEEEKINSDNQYLPSNIMKIKWRERERER